jgi:hypothetical protein
MVVKNLEETEGGSWMCVMARNFMANIMHEPGYFIRLSTE